MGTRAWNDDGQVGQLRWTLFGAVRKAFLYYGDLVTALAKITANGVTYDIKKQAKEGLVTVTEGYGALTFFLPENREPMTAEQGQSMDIKSYFQMLAETDYAEIPAWDYFVGMIGGLTGMMDDPQQTFAYTIKNETEFVIASGTMPLYGVTTFKQLAQRIYETMSIDATSIDADAPLSDWMLEDGTVYIWLKINAVDDEMYFRMEVGRK